MVKNQDKKEQIIKQNKTKNPYIIVMLFYIKSVWGLHKSQYAILLFQLEIFSSD